LQLQTVLSVVALQKIQNERALNREQGKIQFFERVQERRI